MRVIRHNNTSHPRYALNLPIPQEVSKRFKGYVPRIPQNSSDISPEFRRLLWALMIIDRNDNPDSTYAKHIESASVAGTQLIGRRYVIFEK